MDLREKMKNHGRREGLGRVIFYFPDTKRSEEKTGNSVVVLILNKKGIPNEREGLGLRVGDNEAEKN